MVWSSAPLAEYETNRLALDKPLIAPQMIPVTPAVQRWTEVGQTTSTDRTDASYPALRAHDALPGYVTKPDSTSSATWYLVFQTSTAIEFDCAFLLNHNFGTLTLTTVTLEVANSGVFGAGLETIGDFGEPSDDTRLADLELYHFGDTARRYSAQYFRLKLARATPFTPELGELVLGRRRQLEYKPNRPYDEYAMGESSDSLITAGGEIHKTVWSRRAFELTGEFEIDSDTYRDDMVAFYRQCRGPFVWIENPNSAPDSFHYMMREGGLAIPQIEANLRRAELVATEQGGESYYLDVETHG